MEPVGFRPLLQRSESTSTLRLAEPPLRRTQSAPNLRPEHIRHAASIVPDTIRLELTVVFRVEHPQPQPSLLERAHTRLIQYISPSAERAPYYTPMELTLHRFLQIGFTMSIIRSTSFQARAFYRAMGVPQRFQLRALLDGQHSRATYMNMAFVGARIALDRRINMRIASQQGSAYDIPVPPRSNTHT